MTVNVAAKTLQGNVRTSATVQGGLGTVFGKDGKDGASAYEIALANGFEGTEQEWLESLKGKDGAMSFEELTEEQKASLKGDKGDKGDIGDIGPQGPQGIQGEKGDTGPQGPQGTKGDKGDKGDKGEDGTMSFEDLTDEQKASLKGDKGDTGATGPQGPKGDTGATGPQGPQGEKGDTGATGPQGPAYELTVADRATIVNEVIAALPVYNGEVVAI